MGKNRSHGKIDNLPGKLKKEVENRLLEGHTYRAVSDYLAETGHSISYSGVWRYGSDYLKKFEHVRIAREFAKLLAEDNIDRPTTELHEANNALISQIIMEILISDNTDANDKIKAAKAIAELQKAQIHNEKLKIESRKAAGEIHTTMNALKTGLFNRILTYHPDVAEKLLEIAEAEEKELRNSEK